VLLERALLNEKSRHSQLVLHSDNGAPMKSLTLRSKIDLLPNNMN